MLLGNTKRYVLGATENMVLVHNIVMEPEDTQNMVLGGNEAFVWKIPKTWCW